MSSMKERGILCAAPMVRAILEDRKGQTRRVVKPQPDLSVWSIFPTYKLSVRLRTHTKGIDVIFHHTHEERGCYAADDPMFIKCPYGSVGDHLWVREEHYRFGHWEPIPGVKTKTGRMKWRFVADSDDVLFNVLASGYRRGRHHKDPETPAWHKRLARFMPRSASRITLEITEVRVQRLQEISEEDANAEGAPPFDSNDARGRRIVFAPIRDFKALWESIHGAASWEKNPFVWAISFKRIK